MGGGGGGGGSNNDKHLSLSHNLAISLPTTLHNKVNQQKQNEGQQNLIHTGKYHQVAKSQYRYVVSYY